MNKSNNLNLPLAIYNAARNDAYRRGNSDITVTQLISPPQLVELSRRHDADITVDCSDMLYALMGTAMHHILDRAQDKASVMKEHRLYLKVNDWLVSGQFDRLDTATGELGDYKFASVWEAIYGLKPEREAQLNLLAHLCRRNNFTVNKLQVIYLFRDWSKTKALQGGDYPQHQIAVIEVPMWPEDQAAAYLTERVQAHQNARNGLALPQCSNAERWAKPTVYAVMKTGRKSAVKLHDNEAAAQTHAKAEAGGYVQIRPGENTRCASYCQAAQFCPQFEALKEAQA